MFKGWLFDIYPQRGGMTLWMIDTDGGRVRLTDRYRPSFFVVGPPRVLERVRQTLLRSGAPVEFSMTERRDFWTGSAVPVLQVSVDVFTLNSVVRQISRIGGAELYNCDIAPEQMYLYEKRLFPLAFCEIERDAGAAVASIRALEEPWAIDYSMPPLVALKLSVDTNGANPNYGADRSPLKAEIDGRECLLEWDELLDTLEDMLVRYDPDVILTEWGDSFIMPRLAKMALRRERPLSLNRDPRRRIATRKSMSYFSYGRVIYRAGRSRVSMTTSRRSISPRCIRRSWSSTTSRPRRSTAPAATASGCPRSGIASAAGERG